MSAFKVNRSTDHTLSLILMMSWSVPRFVFVSSAVVAHNVSNLTEGLQFIAEYFRVTKLTLNLSKTKLVHIGSRK